MRTFAFVLAFLAGCAADPCITPPPTSTQEQHELAVNLAAQFAAIPVSPSLGVDFKNVSNATFATLNDDNAAYLMTIMAVHCFLKDGKIGQAIAIQLAKDAEQKWFGKTGAASADAHPQAEQVKTIQQAIGVPK